METMMRRLLLPIIHPLPCSWLDLMLLNVDVSAPVPVRSAYKLTPLHLAPITFLYMLTIQHPPTPPLTIPPVCSSFVAFCSGHHSTSVRPSVSQSLEQRASHAVPPPLLLLPTQPTIPNSLMNNKCNGCVCVVPEIQSHGRGVPRGGERDTELFHSGKKRKLKLHLKSLSFNQSNNEKSLG